MGKKVTVMGVCLDNNPIRGSLLILDKLINDPALNLAQMIDAPYLSRVSSDESTREYLEICDHTIIQDVAILKEAGEDSGQRQSEAESGRFFEEFMHRLERGGRTVYLLGDTLEEVARLEDYLKENFGTMKICGRYALEEADLENEKAVNDINDVTPDVILSVLPSPEQEKFYLEHKSKLFAHLFFGARGFVPYHRPKGGLQNFLRRLVSKRVLQAPQNTELNQWIL